MRNKTWGYWAGGIACVLGFLALALGLEPLITRVRLKPETVSAPGRREVRFALPGTYVAVYFRGEMTPVDVQKLEELQFSLSDLQEKKFINIMRFPRQRFLQESKDAEAPLL